MVRSNCFPFAQNQLFFCLGLVFCFNKLVLFGKIGFLFNTSVQKGIYKFVQFLLGFLDFFFQILGERLRRLDIFFFPDFQLAPASFLSSLRKERLLRFCLSTTQPVNPLANIFANMDQVAWYNDNSDMSRHCRAPIERLSPHRIHRISKIQ